MNRKVALVAGLVVTVVAAGAVVGLLITDDEAQPGAGTRGYPRAEVVRALALPDCPRVYEEQVVAPSYRPVDDGDPEVDGLLSVRYTGRHYCLTSFFWDRPRGWEPTTYTVQLRKDPANYGQSYTTTDAEGSDEILNFPFLTTVHGRCSRVAAVVVMTDRKGVEHRYGATARIGPRCPGTR